MRLLARHLPVLPVLAAVPSANAPRLPLAALDTVWIQLTGTVCNIACLHCFISCGPKEERVPMMESAKVREVLREGSSLGVRDYYFTGGEPMLHPDFWALSEAALEVGPLTVLTNGTLIDDAAADRAASLSERSRYSFDLRISLDGMTAEQNDPVRGKGTFEQITAAVSRLAARGVSPNLTVVAHDDEMTAEDARSRFLAFTRTLGLQRPRVKFMPLLRLGREPRRTREYEAEELDCLEGGPDSLRPEIKDALVCGTSRLVAATGVFTCPILLDAPEARLGDTLSESLRPIELRWAACRTCVAEGLSCNT